MNKILLTALGISSADIARQAGVTRQAVTQGSPRIETAASVLIEAAKLDPMKTDEARKLLRDLGEFFA